MKTLVPTIAALFLVLFVLTTFVPYPPARDTALAAGFKDEQIDTGLQITHQSRFFTWTWIALHLAKFYVIALTPVGRRLADRFLAWTGNRRILAALGVGLVLVLIEEILWLPIGIGRHYHAVAWELSNRDLAGWAQDHARSFGINLVLKAIVCAGLYALLILFPRTWWAFGTLGAAGLGIAYAFLSPVLINPLFNNFTPLSQTQWKDQQPRLKALIDRVGVPVQEILVMDASRQSNRSNAYFTGFGSTRRIVLYDNLFKKHTEAEVESILAHELGHWWHDHIVIGFILGTPAALLGLFLLDRLLRRAVGRAPWNLQSTADPAGLPLILLLVYLGGWVAMPVENAVSRHFERQADQASLEWAGQPEVFIATEQKLAVDNKSNLAPTPWNVWLYSTHPPAVERIRMGKEWKK